MEGGMPDAELKTRERQADEPAHPEPLLYDRDFYTWTIEQAAALRAGQLGALDLDNLAEEIEDLGKALFSKLRSSFRVILTHMLKWDHQPERRSRSWAASIKTHRIDIEFLLQENPSLRRRQPEAIAGAFRQARIRAAADMKRSEASLPPTCPYSLNDIIERPFGWPET
jgi:hypothetical protein